MVRRRIAAVMALALSVVVLALAGGAQARPATVQVVLNPDMDTYLGEGVGSPMDGSRTIRAGWYYTTRTREFRAYVRFPIDREHYPPEYLASAELWLYPNSRANTSSPTARYRVRTLTGALTPGLTAPRWPSAGDPSDERTLDTGTVAWKRFDVLDAVRGMLAEGGHAYGFEVSGMDSGENTYFDFVSREGDPPYPDGNQPRLVMVFYDGAFVTEQPPVTEAPSPTPSPTPSATRPATDAPTATLPPSPAATETPTPERTAVPTTQNGTSTIAPGGRVLLPSLRRRG